MTKLGEYKNCIIEFRPNEEASNSKVISAPKEFWDELYYPGLTAPPPETCFGGLFMSTIELWRESTGRVILKLVDWFAID